MKVLMVCWGNICRSPAAEAILRSMASANGIAIEVDSAGTSGEHRGDPPHRRAVAEAARRGLDISGLRARRIRRSDFAEFDFILTADQTVDRIVRHEAPPGSSARIMRMTEFGPDFSEYPDVPDPYYGTEKDYAFVFDLLERALGGLVESLSNLDGDKGSEPHL